MKNNVFFGTIFRLKGIFSETDANSHKRAVLPINIGKIKAQENHLLTCHKKPVRL